MRVGSAYIGVIDLVNKIKTRTATMPKRMRTPNCTHVKMDRIYGRDLQCYVCGRSPSIGFLYECRQDCDSGFLHDLISREDENRIEPVKSTMRLDLESVGLSESIILTAEGGHYTKAQLDKLRELKLDLRQVILDMDQAYHINDAMTALTAIARSAPTKLPSNNDGAFSSMPTKHVQTPLGCTFRACHTCRPYYRDRVFISIQAVLAFNFTPMTRDHSQYLPTKSSQIMQNIGARVQSLPVSLTSTDASHTASTASTDGSDATFKTTQTDIDIVSAQRRPRRRFYRMGRRTSGEIARDLSRLPTFLTASGLKSAVQGIFRPGRESSSSGSNITLPLARTGTVRDLNASQSRREFDLGALRLVRREQEKQELRHGTYTGGFEGVEVAPQHADTAPSFLDAGCGAEESCSSDSNFSVYSSVSQGSEVEVEGGVALTEEAVETHVPDILAIDVCQPKRRSVLYTEEVEDDGKEVNTGLQSIIAQV